MNRLMIRKSGFILVALLTLWLAHPGSAGPEPEKSHPFGKSLGQWEVVWTSWFLGTTIIAPDANGNADVGPVVLLPLPNVPGDGTPGSLDLSFHTGQGFMLPFFQWIGNSYVNGSVDPFADINDFKNMDITVKVDGDAVVTTKNVMEYYTENAFNPPLTTDLPAGTTGWVFVQGVGMVHPPMKPGKHTVTLDESISLPDLGIPGPIIFHNTWNITVKPGNGKDASKEHDDDNQKEFP